MKTVSLTSTLAHVSKTFALVAMVSILSGATFAAEGQADSTLSSGKIAVVDIQYLVSNSKAGKSIRNQLDSQRDAYRSQIEKQENDLRSAEKNLVDQQQKLSKEDFLNQRKAFQDKVMTAQRSVQQRRMAFDKAYTIALEKLREHIVKIVADAAGKNNVALVLNRQEVVLVEEKMDMTKQVLSKLDATVTSIPVTIK
jgi:Skp family chaperone for outer membrane proteins